jgi:molybdate transport system regulatory protein
MNNLRINGRIWLEATGDTETERFMGIGRLELLGHIQRTGSINQAAKAMHMSYKRAWELVHSMNKLADKPLVATQTGGDKGGGALVTEEGLLFIQYYQSLQARFQQFLADELAQLPYQSSPVSQ